MKDQADTLRIMMKQRKWREARKSHVITVASGKGGVGKSCLVANLGSLLARNGFRTLLVDADFGLANLDILFGVQATATLEQVLDERASVQDAVLGIEPNLWLLPSSAGLLELRKSDEVTKARMGDLLASLPWEMDFIIVDAGAGIQENVISLHSNEYESVVVLTPEPTSLADAYGLIKLIGRSAKVGEVGVIVNQVTDSKAAVATFQKLRDVASRFIDVRLDLLGHCQRDEKFTQSVMKRKILLDLDPGAATVASLELLAKRLRAKCLSRNAEGKTLAASPKPVITGRFKDEPAHWAPGNTARFWRTLLGEVNA